MSILENLDLQKVPLFKDLPEAEIKKFIKLTGTTIKNYPKGERILEAFSRNSNIGVIIAGEAQMLSLDRLGNESVGHILEFGAMFGTVSAILMEDTIGTSIQMTRSGTVMWIPYRSLLISGPKLGHTHGIVMKNFLESFCQSNVLMMQKIELLSQKTLRERVILYLFQREKRFQNEVVKVPGRVQMAKELECNRSALTREISQMKAEGLIDFGADWMKLNKEKVN